LEDEMNLDFDDDVEVTPTAGPRLLEPDVEGLECVVVVKNELYEGKERNRVNEVRPVKAQSRAGSSNGESSSRSRATSSPKKASSRRALR
jgi:hypothetical protein